MKLSKILSISLFSFILTLSFAANVFAVEKKAAPSIIIAEVNVFDAKIISQSNQNINLSFGIKNGQIAQANMKYSVSLFKNVSGKEILADEYIYPDNISMSSNSKIIKEIKYTAPKNLNGEYSLRISVVNEGGILLGLASTPNIQLEASSTSVEFLPDLCYLTVEGEKEGVRYELYEGVDIAQTENLIFNCNVLNPSKKDLQVIPKYETRVYSKYGEIVTTTGGSIEPILFKAGEIKKVHLTLPKASKPQVYNISVSLVSGKVASSSFNVSYIIQGDNAAIKSFSLDKNNYLEGENANALLIWKTRTGNKNSRNLLSSSLVTLSLSMTNKNNENCIDPINKVLDFKKSNGREEESIKIIKNCKNPQVLVSLKDSEGNILDSRDLSFRSDKTQVKPISVVTSFLKKNMIPIIAIIVIILVGVVYFISLKKKKDQLGQQDLNKSNETIIK